MGEVGGVLVPDVVTQQLEVLLEAGNYDGAKLLLRPVQEVDAAEAIGNLPRTLQALAFRLLPKDEAIAVYEYLPVDVQQTLLERLRSGEVLELVEAMSPDDRVRLFDELPAKVVRRLQAELSPAERRVTAQLLGYEPETAGRLMTTEFIDLKEFHSAEQALEIVDSLVRSGAVDLVIIDSVAALTPKAELEGEMGDSLPGLQARLMSQALRKLTATIKKTNCTVIFINQIRMKIGVMFGSPETTTGGNALKFYSSVRLDIRRTGSIKKGEEVIGSETRVKVVKNKVSPPFKTAEFDILYGEGISREGEIIDMGVQAQVVDKSGAWYAYKGEKIGQGKDNAREFLRENPEIAVEIENRIREFMGIPLLESSADAP